MTKLLPVAVAVGTVLAGCASTPPEEDPVQIKLNDLDARVARIERVVSNQSLVQLAQSLDSVQAETRRLRGRIDELENSNETMKKQLASRGASTDVVAPGGSQGSSGSAAAVAAGPVGGVPASAPASASALGGVAGAGAATAVAPGPGATDAPPGTAGSSVEQAVYSQAFSALKAGSYSVAITGFKDFLSSYPASGLAENAQYWLGEAYYVTRSYDDAGTAFRTVLQKYPQSRKAPDAMLKLGFTQYEQKRYADSRKTLEDVTQKFPDSDAARLATDRLKRIPANAPKG
jgi:tol-pal system protein YbgF